MELKAEMAVIVAAQVNTALMNQIWMVKNGFLSEADLENSVFGTGIIQARTPHFEFTALPDRIQFVATGTDESTDEDRGRIAFEKSIELVKLLPHTPYTALGMNFIWLCRADSPCAQGRVLFAPRDLFLSKWFSSDDSRFGGYASCHFKGDVRLKLTVSPIHTNDDRKGEYFQAAFNYHADVSSITTLVASLSLWSDAREHSKTIATDFAERLKRCLTN